MTEASSAICIFELKVDKTADIALTQAIVKKYRNRFSQSEKETLVIGINFGSKTRDIDDWKAVLYSPEGEFTREILPKEEKEPSLLS